MRDWSQVSSQLEALEALYAAQREAAAAFDERIAALRAEIVEIVGKPTPEEAKSVRDEVFSSELCMAYDMARAAASELDDFDILDEIRQFEGD